MTTEGDVTAAVAVAEPPPAEPRTRESRREATNRWVREGRAAEVEAFRDDERAKCTAAGMSRPAARDEAWARALAKFPPPGVDSVAPPEPNAPAETPPAAPDAPETGVSGLGDIPAGWPDLPANASLAAEVQWVQSSRLDVVTGPAAVDLARADRPAPSKAALSWLETSILFPAKFTDVAVKATQNQEDEREHTRREKAAVEDIHGLLADMREQ